jgi:enoyl-CoA hydratase
MSTAVQLSKRGKCALLTLNRPEALNALSFEILKDIANAIDSVALDHEVRALLITGAGEKAFCAGADINELRNRRLIDQKRGAEFGQAVFARLDAFPVASIALINGYAFGGGAELALACTFRLASQNASFGLPEIKLGLIPGYGGTQRLPRLIGEARALEIIMTGRSVKADEALRIGLVNAVIEGDLVDGALEFAARFTQYSLPVLELARRAVQRAGDVSLTEGLRMEADLSTLAYRTNDAEEGMAAFQEKRKPEFKDG